MKRRFLCLLAVLSVASVAYSFRSVEPTGVQAASIASSIVDGVDAETRAALVLGVGDESRLGWHFIPKDARKGVAYRDMDDAGRKATVDLLTVVLSDVGLKKVSAIRTLEGIVRDLEGEGRRWSRDPEEYHLTLFGEPSKTGRWGISFEGHHVSINALYEDGQLVASTPQFLGSHPAVVAADVPGNPAGRDWAVLRDEAELAFALADSLTDEQRRSARVSETAQQEIRNSGEPQATEYAAPAGVSGKDLNSTQRRLLAELVAVYCEVFNDAAAARRMLEIDGLDDVQFSYSGTMQWGEPHAYVVQGPTFVIDYVNTQPDAQGNPANHAHCIYRDLRGDFGVRD